MRITQEADYALRIVCLLSEKDDMMDAASIAEACCITPRFALKILHKLVLGGVVRSYKGAGGGYRTAKTPSEITMREIIELIDGEIAISRCLTDGHVCSKSGDNMSTCKVHCVFDAINRDVVKKLENVRVSDLIRPSATAEDIIKNF